MIMMIIYHENIYVVCALCNGEKFLIWSYETFPCVKPTVQGAPFMEADPITWSKTAPRPPDTITSSANDGFNFV